MEKKSKPIKKYTEEEQFERRQEDYAVIVGKKKEKCYPLKKGVDVTICNHNKKGCCDLFNKKCDNMQEKKNKVTNIFDHVSPIKESLDVEE